MACLVSIVPSPKKASVRKSHINDDIKGVKSVRNTSLTSCAQNKGRQLI